MSKTIEVSEETYEKIKDQLLSEEKCDLNSYEDFIGKKFFFRTVTYHTVGEVTGIVGGFFKMKNASWVAESARFADTVKTGILDELEPVGSMGVNISTIVDYFPWRHELPTEQK
jgi:hypothetical protein